MIDMSLLRGDGMMMRWLDRDHNRLRWLLIAILFFVPLIPPYILELQVSPLENAFRSTSNDFQYTNGDVETDQLEDPAIIWHDFDPYEHGLVTGIYWFKYTLPENRWRDPYLQWVYTFNAEIVLDGQMIYEAPASRFSVRDNPYFIKLPDDFSGKQIFIRIDFQQTHLHPGIMIIDSSLHFIQKVLLQSNYRILLGFTALLVSIAGTILYLARRQLSYLYFSLFALYIVCLCVGRSGELLGLFTHHSWIRYLLDVFLALGGFFFLGFYEEIFGKGKYHIHRWLKYTMLFLFAVLAIMAYLSPMFYYFTMTGVMENWVSPIILFIILVSAINTYRSKKDAETFWFMAGFVTFGLFVMVYFLQPIVQPVVDLLSTAFPWVQHFAGLLYGGDRFLHGIFILLFCMAMILNERIRSVYLEATQTAAELTRMSQSLEKLVQERTKALEQTNRNLRTSMQETAQVLAEVAVLEDRNRIAQDMHDHIGHSLTAALIQIEAAKLVAMKDVHLTLKKLEAARESVATGLDNIRETVRMMKLDYEERALIPSLQKLIQEIQNSTGVSVSYQPEILPDLDVNVKKTLYRALQEGLTNGIRHGRATHFYFSLNMKENWIQFRLGNNGKKYTGEPHGFGLNTMRERVEQLKGKMEIGSEANYGFLLSIDLPMEDHECG